jgi:hypothetical protein
MKQLTQDGQDYSKNAKVVAAVDAFITDLNNGAEPVEGRHFRWATRWNGAKRDLRAGKWGTIALIDGEAETEQNNYGLVVWSHKGELFIVPSFAEDGWTGRNANGIFYTVDDNEQPVVEQD